MRKMITVLVNPLWPILIVLITANIFHAQCRFAIYSRYIFMKPASGQMQVLIDGVVEKTVLIEDKFIIVNDVPIAYEIENKSISRYSVSFIYPNGEHFLYENFDISRIRFISNYANIGFGSSSLYDNSEEFTKRLMMDTIMAYIRYKVLFRHLFLWSLFAIPLIFIGYIMYIKPQIVIRTYKCNQPSEKRLKIIGITIIITCILVPFFLLNPL